MMRGAAYHRHARHGHRHRVVGDGRRIACMYAFKSLCPPHFNMAGGGRGVKAILNEFSLPAKCELMIRSLAKLGTRAIRRQRLHAHAMYGC